MNRFAHAAAPALVLLSLGAYAALNAQGAPMQLPGKVDPARVTPGLYVVDGGHTLISWRVNHFGFNDYFGIFGEVTGSLQLDPRNLTTAKLDVTIPVAKVTVASAGLRDHLLRPGKDGTKPDFFGPNPASARFTSTVIRRTGPLKANITGNFTLNGITRPVTIAAEFTGAGPHPMNKRLNIGFRGRTTIKRSDYGINYALPLVSDAVELDISAAFEKPANTLEKDACNSTRASDAVGKRDTPALREAVALQIGHTRIRWLPPGTIVTQDYRENRLNVDIDERGMVTRLRCG
jgi:polyisoprenoid-binding protein YceI